MDKKSIKFDDTETEEYEFHQHESPISISDTDIHEIAVSNKLPFGQQDFKYFIGYKDNKKLDHYEYSFQKINTLKREIVYEKLFREFLSNSRK